MLYDPVHAMKGVHACYEAIGFTIALAAGMTGYQEAKESLKAESSSSATQNEEGGKPLNLLARLLGIAFGYACLLYLILAILGLKLYRVATRRDS